MIAKQLLLPQPSCSCSTKEDRENDSIKKGKLSTISYSAADVLLQSLAVTEAGKCGNFSSRHL